MHAKHIFLRVFSKIAILVCVFCVFSAWAETTTCDIDFTPITGNSWQNGTPTPTSPVEIESVGTKVGNKYQISVVAQGKNLFDIENATWGENIDANGTEVTSQYSSHSDYIECKPNTTYTVSWVSNVSLAPATIVTRYHEYDSNKTWLRQITTHDSTGLGKKNITFTTGATAKYIRFTFRGVSISDSDLSTNIMLEQGSVATPYAQYSAPTTTPIYLNAPLRKVGDYADVLDYKKGQIIRNVGVKVLDGTEGWVFRQTSGFNESYLYEPTLKFKRGLTNMLIGVSSHFQGGVTSGVPPVNSFRLCPYNSDLSQAMFDINIGDIAGSLAGFKSWLASQYANGTPVIVYYPLATPVVEQIENWSCIPPITDIKIATTKMVDEEFAAAEAKLATTVQTIESVVSRTIAQTGQIATLQAEKQTRPDESCPANMKCLLVQDEDGTPHWYPIIEP